MSKALNHGLPPLTLKHWLGTDSQENFQKHWNDPTTRSILLDNGWDSDSIIEYHLNLHALRNAAGTIVNGSVLALGCSHTFGVGLHDHQIWPHLLGEELGMPAYNAGVPGGSADTAFRILTTLLINHRPSAVFCLCPYNNRWEFVVDNEFENFGLWGRWIEDPTLKPVTELHINETRNSFNEAKNLLAMEQLCSRVNIPFTWMDLETKPIILENDWGRDLAHQGPKWHRAITQQMLDRYNENIQ